MSNFISAGRATAYLLPPSVDEWRTQDHLARFVVEAIDQLELSELTRKYVVGPCKIPQPRKNTGALGQIPMVRTPSTWFNRGQFPGAFAT